ncbi:MAG: aminopeptidase P family protein, partial [Trebonia sp.]
MPEVHAARRRRAQRLIRESGAEAALITAGPNVRYLTGLASSNAALLLPAEGDGALLATDSRYAGAARRDAPDLNLVEDRFIEARLATEAATLSIGRLAFEAHEMTVERHGELTAKAEGVVTLPFGRKIEALRLVKDTEELEKLEVACRLTDAALAEVLPQIRPGLSERMLATLLDHTMA